MNNVKNKFSNWYGFVLVCRLRINQLRRGIDGGLGVNLLKILSILLQIMCLIRKNQSL